MDPNHQIVTEEERKKIYKELADALIVGLENGEILNDEAQKSSEFILQQLDAIQTKDKLLAFLETLTTSWPVYNIASNKIKSEEIKENDAEKIKQIENAIDTFSNKQ